MKNICFVVYDLSVVGGVERVVESLANRLSENHIVHIVSLHSNALNPAFQFNKSISIGFFNMKEDRLRNQMIEGTIKLANYFRRYKIDVAFLEATYAGFIGAPLGILSKTKICFCDHGALYNQLEDNDITSMRRISAKLCNKIIVLTQRSADDYKKYFNINRSKIIAIYNWIKEALVDESREYDVDSKIIVTAGRFTKEKGFDLLVEVAKIVLKNNPDWKWYVYGDGPLKESIEQKIVEANLEDSLILKGFAHNIEEIYGRASLYVLPSYREGIPLVLLEAKAYKLPCVSFDVVTGPNEIIENNVNGLLVEPYDIYAMASGINQLILDPELRKQFSDQAYSNIWKFRESTILKQWEKAIL